MTLEEIIREKHSGDEDQLEFIFSDDKKIIVTAPAGCGKTTAMVSKIARELSTGHIPANKKVLAMTFSVNAAMKIKDSLKTLLPDFVENTEKYISKVDIANYHNFAMRLLFKHGYSLNPEFSNLFEFKVVDDSSHVLDAFIIGSDSDKLKALDDAVKKSNKDNLMNALDDYWDILNKKLITNHVITYNGILVSAIKLLCKRQVSSFYKEYYQMIIVDEFQDTNLLGYLLIKKLIGDNIVVFLGDDVQKIYGFLGAINGIFSMFIKSYPAVEIEFHSNYRFRNNERMKNLDSLIRDYSENYGPSKLKASVLLKNLDSDEEEDEFIVEGINRMISNLDDKVAVLVRAGWQGNSIVTKLDQKGIKYFNALFRETDPEYLKFYSIAIEEFHNTTSGRAVQRDLQKCLDAVKSREHEIYQQNDKKFIFDAMYKLLEVLFNESRNWEGTSKDKYDNIDFTLGNNGLKHMMEFIDESVVLTSIHSAKGLEWEYVIIPKLNGFAFPSSYVCRPCRNVYSCNSGFDYCEFLYEETMEKAFKEEISVLYVAVTRAKKDVFMTVNTGINHWNHTKQTSCLLNLKGLSTEDYDWEDVFE
ncbi:MULTISPECIES: UvrD-helicase domain-containing protein [unclassified Sedimentibacter]|uniref:UvrD-helicase domain-containing protein n=1 Tax=unclassified Sedimentibacter TaxID=2649220 RepID=UPI0027DF8400|nr:ATP-dependent helicase [Sedimentibacter sp. MB35-C1]WMJ77319.1 ATP-dependent helicase [Sedimentibacter sp. MB35-C1]